MSQLYAPSVAITRRWEREDDGLLRELGAATASKSTIAITLPTLSTPPPPLSLSCNSSSAYRLRGNSSFKCSSVLPVKQQTFDDDYDDDAAARFACRQAIKNGKGRLQLELPLPLIGATDLDDWPGGIQQQFKAAVPMVNLMLTGLTKRDPTEEITFQKYIVDEGDAVGVWENDDIALALFPTADSLSKVEALARVQGRPLILFNAQWQIGQVMSDFGFGDQRRARERFVESFSIIYYLKQYRLQGQNMRLLKCYPGDWQVFIIDSQGDSNCAAVTMHRPSYNEMEEILKKQMGPKEGNNWFSRLFQ
ncbi:hypothetical protein O6H91_06G062800 [Diphasiastrum complanatum]|uniref:Uncharacterized protein n=1 Tax=Diphasiastrum complanatum TaxID=34168 RepID=A0ACC2DEG5_DIPCM|nr:hypothetical protein O6H91_06G062800 [Diphasiastrum complanatum]